MALHQRYEMLQCHYKYHPLCVLNLPIDSSTFPNQWPAVRKALQGAMLAYNATDDIHQLDLLIDQLNNLSRTFEEKREQEERSIFDWLQRILDLHWLPGVLSSVAVLVLMCLVLPCLLKCLLQLLTRALESLKGDVLSLRHREGRSPWEESPNLPV